VTFRSRVITATVAAAAIAVILACFASFLTTRNSLIHSVDESLHAEATPSGGGHEISFVAFLVLPTGQTVLLPTGQTVPSSRIHVDATILAVARGKSQPVYRTVAIGGNNYRELIVPIVANSIGTCADVNACLIKTTSAELFITNIDGQVNELRNLVRTLTFVAIGGLLLALGLVCSSREPRYDRSRR